MRAGRSGWGHPAGPCPANGRGQEPPALRRTITTKGMPPQRNVIRLHSGLFDDLPQVLLPTIGGELIAPAERAAVVRVTLQLCLREWAPDVLATLASNVLPAYTRCRETDARRYPGLDPTLAGALHGEYELWRFENLDSLPADCSPRQQPLLELRQSLLAWADRWHLRAAQGQPEWVIDHALTRTLPAWYRASGQASELDLTNPHAVSAGLDMDWENYVQTVRENLLAPVGTDWVFYPAASWKDPALPDPPSLPPYGRCTNAEYKAIVLKEVDAYLETVSAAQKRHNFVSARLKRDRGDGLMLHFRWFVAYQVMCQDFEAIAQAYMDADPEGERDASTERIRKAVAGLANDTGLRLRKQKRK